MSGISNRWSSDAPAENSNLKNYNKKVISGIYKPLMLDSSSGTDARKSMRGPDAAAAAAAARVTGGVWYRCMVRGVFGTLERRGGARVEPTSIKVVDA